MKLLLTLFLSFNCFAITLPKDVKWITNNEDPVFASSDAKRGGTFNLPLLSFPLTLRYVGPDSNGSFRGVINNNRFGLVDMHPNTLNYIPQLATHWAYDKDGLTTYYKLDKAAKWSDGKPVTADDYVFALKFYRSKEITAPWYNNHYTEYFDSISKIDDYTIAIKGKKKLSKFEIHQYNGITPIPRHFHKLDKNWVKNHNWKIEPNTGPYQISTIKKGKSIVLKRKKNWWGNNHKYYKNRFNVDKVRYKVIRDQNVSYKHFLKGNLETYYMVRPDVWHDKAKGKEFDNGLIHKIQFFNDAPQPNIAIWLNQAKPIFRDKKVRQAFGYATNVEKVMKTVLRGDYYRLQTGDQGKGKYFNPKISPRKYDLKKANKLLDEAGWSKRGPDGIRIKNGQKLSAKITYGAPHYTERLVVIKEDMKKAGIELVLNLMDSSAAFKSILEKQHDLTATGWSSGFLPAYWEGYHSANANKPQTNNISNTANPEIDKYIDLFRNTIDEKKKISYAHKVQELIHEDAAYIPTFMVPYTRQGFWSYIRLPKVPGTKLTDDLFDPFNTTYGGLFWIDGDLRKKVQKAKKSGKKLEAKTIIDTTYKIKGI